MATITSAASGNFSDTATWVGGVVPGAADIAVADTGHTVTIDSDVTVTEFQQAGTGKFTLGNDRTITGIVRAVAGTTTSGTVQCAATTTATINGNVIGSSTTNSTTAVFMSGTGTLTINGNVTHGANAGVGGRQAIQWNAGNLTINGNVTGGNSTTNSGSGITLTGSSSGILTIVGTVTGGNAGNANVDASAVFLNASPTINVTGAVYAGTRPTGTRSAGFYLTGSPTITVTGNVYSGTNTNGIELTGSNGIIYVVGDIVSNGTVVILTSRTTGSGFVDVIGDVYAASGLGHGVLEQNTQGYVVHTGDQISGNDATLAIVARRIRLRSTVGITHSYVNGTGYPNGARILVKSLDSTDFDVPDPSDVRYGTLYGNSIYTGTLSVPPAESVASGVPVDDTVGTAALSTTDIAALVGAQIAAAVRTPQ